MIIKAFFDNDFISLYQSFFFECIRCHKFLEHYRSVGIGGDVEDIHQKINWSTGMPIDDFYEYYKKKFSRHIASVEKGEYKNHKYNPFYFERNPYLKNKEHNFTFDLFYKYLLFWSYSFFEVIDNKSKSKRLTKSQRNKACNLFADMFNHYLSYCDKESYVDFIDDLSDVEFEIAYSMISEWNNGNEVYYFVYRDVFLIQ